MARTPKSRSETVSIGSGSLPRIITKKLTDWKKEPDLLDLKADLEGARGSHDSMVNKIKHWRDLRDVTGSAAPVKVTGRSSIQPKLIRRQAEWRYSALSEPFNSGPNLFTAKPRTAEDATAAKQNALLLNYQFDTKIDRVKLVDEYVRTTVDEGTVIVRTGWERVTRKVTKKEPIFNYMEVQSEEELQKLEQAMALKMHNPRGFKDLPEEIQASVEYLMETQKPTVAEIAGYEDVESEEVLVNKPTVEVLNAENVFIDPSCGSNLEKAGFVVYSFETSKAELKKDGRYKNLDAVNWSGASILGQPDHDSKTPGDFNFKDDLRKRIVAYEYWGYAPINDDDILVPIVATWIGDVLVRLEENPFPDGLPPFVVVPYLPIKNQLAGEPDAEILEDNQRVMGATYRGIIDLMGRSANAQQGTAKGFLDTVNRRRYEQGKDYEFNPSNGDPRLSVYQHQFPEIPASAMNLIQLQNYEAEALSGVKAFAGGLSGNAYGDVAAGIKGMLDAAAKREMNILRRLASGMKKIGVKICAMNAVFLSEEEVVRITNTTFVTVKREELKGNFDLVVDIATAEVDMAKSQDLGFMLQTMGPNMDAGLGNKVLAEISELKQMPDLAEEIRQYKPAPDPIAEQIKQLEVKKLEMEIQKLQSDIAKNQSEIAKNEAVAQKTSTEADLNNLQFLEQESGTHHARDLEKQSEQARSNQGLAVTKALLATRKPEETKPDIAAAVGFNRISDAMAAQ